jgi:hypothetical protein
VVRCLEQQGCSRVFVPRSAEEFFGFRAGTPLEEGLRRMIDTYRESTYRESMGRESLGA